LLNHDVISNINQLHIENILEVDYDFKSFGLIWFQQDLGFQISDSLLKEFQNK
jgi:hypothetical protein